MDLLNDVLKQLGGLSNECLFAVGLYVVGVVLKRVPQFPNGLIPVVMVLGLGPAGGYFFLNNPGQADPTLTHPEIRAVCIGLAVAAAVCFFHDKVGRYVEKLLPAGLSDQPKPNETNEKINIPSTHPPVGP